MLLDPLEEQLDLPAVFVQRGNRQRRQGGIVGQEHQRLAGFRVLETDATQQLGIGLCGVEAIQRDALIADDGRGGRGAIGRKQGRQLPQCAGRDDQRVVQDGTDPPARPVEDAGDGGACQDGMGGVVQARQAARTHRLYPARRSGGKPYWQLAEQTSTACT